MSDYLLRLDFCGPCLGPTVPSITFAAWAVLTYTHKRMKYTQYKLMFSVALLKTELKLALVFLIRLTSAELVLRIGSVY